MIAFGIGMFFLIGGAVIATQNTQSKISIPLFFSGIALVVMSISGH